MKQVWTSNANNVEARDRMLPVTDDQNRVLDDWNYLEARFNEFGVANRDSTRVIRRTLTHFMAFAPNQISYHAVRMDIPAESKRQERPVIRGFMRKGRRLGNWLRVVHM